MDIQETRDYRNFQSLKHELGLEILAALENDDIVEILLNPDGQVWQDNGQEMKPITSLNPQQALKIISTVAGINGEFVTPEKPIYEAELPLNKERFSAWIPPLVSAAAFSIRKHAKRVYTLDDYQDAGIITEKQKETLTEMVIDSKNILIAGATGSGKTTFANAILDAIAKHTPHHRVTIVEDTLELQCPVDNLVAYRTYEHVSIQNAVRLLMRARPDRIVVGEVRGGEALDMIKAWQTGHRGGLTTTHAGSVVGALRRIKNLCEEQNLADHTETIADSIDYVAVIENKRTPEGGARRQIKELAEISFNDKTLTTNIEYINF